MKRKRFWAGILVICLACGIILDNKILMAAPPQDLYGGITHYNAILFDYFEAQRADMEGALAVGGPSKLGTSGQYDIGASAASGYSYVTIGKYENPNGYPTLLLNGLPEVGKAGTSNVHAYGGPIVISDEFKTQYQQQANKIVGTTEFGPESRVNSFFSQTKGAVVQAVNNLNSANTKEGSFIDVSEFAAYWIPKSPFKDITDLTTSDFVPNNMNLGGNALVININSPSDFSMTQPTITASSSSKKFSDFDVIVFNFPDAVNVEFFGGSLIADGKSLNTSASGYYSPTQNALLTTYATKVVWNFPNAETIHLDQHGVVGSVLAPYAKVTTKGGSINGMLIASSLYSKEGFEMHGFRMKDIVFEDPDPDPDDPHEVEFIKVDAKDNAIVLEGARFTLWRERKDVPGTYDQVMTSDGLHYFETDEFGYFKAEDLINGKYQLREILAPNGYIKDDIVLEFVVPDDVQVGIPFIIENEPKEAELDLVKVDAGDNSTLEGAVFSLYREYETNSVTNTKGYDHIADYVTLSDGKISITGLTIGNYILVEKQAPNGYEPLDDFLEITVTDLGGANDLVVVPSWNSGAAVSKDGSGAIQIPNPPSDPADPPKVIIIKEDEEGNVLEGAVFQLYKDDGIIYNVLGSAYTTNESGMVIIDFAELINNGTITSAELDGKYMLYESTPPDGYKVIQDRYYFEITDGGTKVVRRATAFGMMPQILIPQEDLEEEFELEIIELGEEEKDAPELNEENELENNNEEDGQTQEDNNSFGDNDADGQQPADENSGGQEDANDGSNDSQDNNSDSGADASSDSGGDSSGSDDASEVGYAPTRFLPATAARGITLANADPIDPSDNDASDEQGDGGSNEDGGSEPTDDGGENDPAEEDDGDDELTPDDNNNNNSGDNDNEFSLGDNDDNNNANEPEEDENGEDNDKDENGQNELDEEELDEEEEGKGPGLAGGGGIKNNGLAPSGFMPFGGPLDTLDDNILYITVVNEAIEYPLTIKKVIKDTTTGLGGVTFKLYKDMNGQTKFIGEYETDANGLVTGLKLPKGKYTIDEFKTLDGYTTITDQIEFELPGTGSSTSSSGVGITYTTEGGVEITVPNEAVTGSVKVKKVGIDLLTSQSEIDLDNVVFELYYLSGRAWLPYTTDFTHTTGSSGSGEFEITDLPAGYYMLKEVSNPNSGYAVTDPEASEYKLYFRIKGQSQTEPLELGMRNYKKYPEISLDVYKIDSDFKEPLTDAIFELLIPEEHAAGDWDTVDYHFNKYWVSYRTGLRTDANGKIIIDNLPEGTYLIREIRPPDGYLPDDPAEPIMIMFKVAADLTVAAIDSNPSGIQFGGGNVTIENVYNPQFPEMKIIKRDRATGAALQGAEFGLYHSTTRNGTYHLVDIVVSNRYGEILFNEIEEGFYRLIEEKPPEGYEKRDVTFEFEVRELPDPSNSGQTILTAFYNYRGQDIEITMDMDIELNIYNDKGGGDNPDPDPDPKDPDPKDPDPKDPDPKDPPDPDNPGPKRPKPDPDPDPEDPPSDPDPNDPDPEDPPEEWTPPPSYTFERVDDDTYLVLDEDGVPIGYIKVPEGMNLDDIYINLPEDIIPLGKINPKTGDLETILMDNIPTILFLSVALFARFVLRITKRRGQH